MTMLFSYCWEEDATRITSFYYITFNIFHIRRVLTTKVRQLIITLQSHNYPLLSPLDHTMYVVRIKADHNVQHPHLIKIILSCKSLDYIFIIYAISINPLKVHLFVILCLSYIYISIVSLVQFSFLEKRISIGISIINKNITFFTPSNSNAFLFHITFRQIKSKG